MTEQEHVSRETEEQAPEEQEHVSRETEEQATEEQEQEQEQDSDLQQTFNREYVEQLRNKSNGYRLRAKGAEEQVAELQRQLFNERLQRLDMVVDNDAVPYDAALLEDETALVEHIEQLLEAKPYLKKRQYGGDIGQHKAAGNGKAGFSLADVLRHNAG